MIAAWGLLMVLTFPPTPNCPDGCSWVKTNPTTISQSVLYFPTKDQCEAGAKLIIDTIPGDWKHVCIPMIGSAR